MVLTSTNTMKRMKKIGECVHLVDERNTDLAITNLLGIAKDKCFIPSVANVIGTDLSKYKVIRKGRFSCNLMHVNRDEVLPVALYTDVRPAIISPAYPMFEVNDANELLPEYLNLYLMRKEFDREVVFYAMNGIRGGLEWDDFMNIDIPIPDVNEQLRIINEYHTLEKRVENNILLIKNIDEIAIDIYIDTFDSKEDSTIKLGELFIPKRGKNIVIGDCIDGEVPVIAAGLEPACYHNESNTNAPVITISSSGANAGYVRLNRQKVWASDCSYIDDTIYPYIYFAYVCLKRQQDYLLAIQEGTGQGHIYPDHISSLEIKSCTKDEIEGYNKKVSDLFKMRFICEEENDTIKKIMPLLLTKLA